MSTNKSVITLSHGRSTFNVLCRQQDGVLHKQYISYEISGSNGGDYEDDCPLGRCDRPDNGGSKHLWNVGKLLPDYTTQHSRRQSSSKRALSAPPQSGRSIYLRHLTLNKYELRIWHYVTLFLYKLYYNRPLHTKTKYLLTAIRPFIKVTIRPILMYKNILRLGNFSTYPHYPNYIGYKY
jgi:hypothetical protein